ncbi:DUF427 domain-containing protein [Roseivirga sp. BDSF3-8]|uniref:DUF427 domain-containing protein n=1 Tax=Roseivirga sp. BDSF3-8 TaxID=3241598 RepID=UPI0035319A19
MSKSTKREPARKGEESVWDYPRPPAIQPESRHVMVVIDGVVVADSNKAYRVLETSHPPVFYIPPKDVRTDLLVTSAKSSFCEFKGKALYAKYEHGNKSIEAVAWYYPSPDKAYESIKGYYAFYPSKADKCMVADEEVMAQEGDFYGGWITREIKGPFKGGAGTWGW